MALTFSTDSSDFMTQKFECNVPDFTLDEEENVYLKFELLRCLHWINDNTYTKVALQFSDEQLRYSLQIACWLETKSQKEIFVLGDTSYGSCCVDEITAEHVSADAVIHFGRTCLSPTTRLPVLYIFGMEPLDVDDVVKNCQQLSLDTNCPIIILYDVIYSHAVDKLAILMEKSYQSVSLSRLNIPNQDDSENNSISKCGRFINPHNGVHIDDCCMLYIGQESLTQANLFLTFNRNRFLTYDPSKRKASWDSVNTNRKLQKRYFLIEKIKDAKIIAILVGTLGVKNYMGIIKHLKIIIRATGKRVYTLSMGKPNPAKLANFSEVDIYVLVACPENSLLESKEYYRPIVTPFELEIALNKSKTWDGQYITNFSNIIEGGPDYSPLEEWGDDHTDVSLISGKVRSLRTKQVNEDEAGPESQAVELRNEMTIASLHQDGAGNYLASRSWKGLEQKLGETPVSKATEGRHGVAASYAEEKEIL